MSEKFIPFYRPLIEDDEIAEVVDTLKSDWITTGPKTKRFEKEFAKFIGCKHAIAVNSGTSALHLGLVAAGIEEGDEVILPTTTFAATAEVVIYQKAKPVLVDIDKDTFDIDVEKIEQKISPKTKVIIPVHIAGQPCEMDEILDVAKKYNLKIIEDAAHALPARYKGKMIGTMGDVTAFSFYATKNLVTAEGGMATTDNDEYAEKMRILSLHGISKDAWKRYSTEGSWYYEILYPGFKYNMTDIQASLGIHQLKKLDKMQERRKEIVDSYNEAFFDVPEIIVPKVSEKVEHAWHLYIIKLNLERLKINRDEFIQTLTAENIGVSVHFIPLHMHPYYRDTNDYKPGDFPNAKYIYDRVISLPLYPKMSKQDVANVIAAVKKTIEENRK